MCAGSPVEASPFRPFSRLFFINGYPCRRCLHFRSICLYSTVRFRAYLLSLLFLFVTAAFYFFTSDLSVNSISQSLIACRTVA